MPKVTVAVPFYNDAPYLREAVDSILAQSFQDFELLLVNDGTTDESAAILAAYTDPRIRIITFPENRGRPHARNAALEHAEGEYLAWLDADDIAMPDRLKKQVDFLDAHPNVAITSGAIERFHEAEGIFHPPLHHNEIAASLLLYCSILQTTSCFNLKKIREAQLCYDNAFQRSEDYEFWCRALFDAKIVAENQEDVLTRYRHFKRPAKSEWHKMVVCRNLDRLHIEYDNDDTEILVSLCYDTRKDTALRYNIDNILKIIDKIILSNNSLQLIDEKSLLIFFQRSIEELLLENGNFLAPYSIYKKSFTGSGSSNLFPIKYILKKLFNV